MSLSAVDAATTSARPLDGLSAISSSSRSLARKCTSGGRAFPEPAGNDRPPPCVTGPLARQAAREAKPHKQKGVRVRPERVTARRESRDWSDKREERSWKGPTYASRR